MSNEKTIYEEPFFTNERIPYCIKAGMVAVIGGLNIFFYKNKLSKDTFMAQKTSSNRTIEGTITFTFGCPESMGENNCIASLKSIQTEKLSTVLDGIVKNQTKNDQEVVNALVEYIATSGNLSPDGVKGQWRETILPEFDKYINYCKSNNEYNGMFPDSLVNNLRSLCEETFSKKKQMTEEMQQA